MRVVLLRVSPALSLMDYFSFLGLPRLLTLDTVALEKQFYAMSRQLHPDRFAGRTAAEQEDALARSSLLNDAYRTLRDPVERTEYLLKLEGVDLEEQSRQATDASNQSGTQKMQLVPPDLLEEVFELNMQLDEMRMAKKMGPAGGESDPGLRESLLAAKKDFETQLAVLQMELEALWAEWDAALIAQDASAKDAVKSKMVDLLNRRSYIRNLVRDVNEVLNQ
ncbi:MAG: Fe-S protein assembly co-chaperone HscB [Acidobacteriaceae bacterium]